jgi:purine-nucleoside phosphorylase
VLGSGLGAFADEFAGATRIDYKKIPHFPRSTAIGHAGRMVIGKVADVAGGGHAGPRAFLRRLLAAASHFSDARDGANGNSRRGADQRRRRDQSDFKQGCLVVIARSHQSAGHESLDRSERRSLRRALSRHDAGLLEALSSGIALQEGKRLGIEMAQGVYAALTGPSYETPPRFAILRTIGADLVGMSTVPEVIAAAHLGIRVLGISCVTNMAAGILDQPITTEEVIETGERVKADFVALLRAVIPRIE